MCTNYTHLNKIILILSRKSTSEVDSISMFDDLDFLHFSSVVVVSWREVVGVFLVVHSVL